MLSYERPTMAQAASTNIPISAPSSSNTMSSGTLQPSNKPDTKHHIWLITGPAGSGKSTVAQFIAKTMNLPFIEGDEVTTNPRPISHVNLTITSTTRSPMSRRCPKAFLSPTLTAGTGSPSSETSPSVAYNMARKALSSPAQPSSANTET